MCNDEDILNYYRHTNFFDLPELEENEMSIQLKNIKHGFDVNRGDVGVTVRKGTKWSGYREGTMLDLWECEEGHPGDCATYGKCLYRGSAKILGSWVGRLVELPPSLLAMEHNIEARDMSVLKMMLILGYGQISDDDIVTALIYERVSVVE